MKQRMAGKKSFPQGNNRTGRLMWHVFCYIYGYSNHPSIQERAMQVQIPEYKAQIGGAVVFCLLALLLYFVIIPREIIFAQVHMGVSPRYFPNLLAGLLFIFAIALGVDGYRMRHKKKQKIFTFTLRETRMVAVTLLIIALQILAFDLIGYLIPAMAAIAACMYVFGNRKYLMIALVSVLLPIAIKLSFEKLLQVSLP